MGSEMCIRDRVIVALLVTSTPPNALPSITNSSPAKYPEPPTTTLAVYPVSNLVTLNVALAPPTVYDVYAGLL